MQGNSKRQKMINLMYIVLIALMGLGVHRESKQKSTTAPTQGGSEDVPVSTEAAPSLSEPKPQRLRAVSMPEQSIVLLGDTYRAHIALVQTDTSAMEVYLDGRSQALEGGRYSVRASRTGVHSYRGYILLPATESEAVRYPFEGQYQVLEPSLVVAPRLQRVLYAGIDNALDISVSGVEASRVHVEMTGGSIRYYQGYWLAKPHNREGEAQLSVYRQTAGGGRIMVGQQSLRVRPLPPPSPYIAMGEGRRFRGGTIARDALLASGGVRAAIDDGLLDLEYRVESFQTVAFDGLGNAIPEISIGARFSPRQVRQIQSYTRGKRLYISEIKARAADGVLHSLPALELIIN